MANCQHTLNSSARLVSEIDGAGPPTPGRRCLLALAAGAATIATTAAAAAIEEPLDTWWHRYKQACQRFTDAAEAEWDAIAVARAQWPPRPRILFSRKYGTDKLLALDEETITRWRDQARSTGLPRSAEIHEKQLAALKSWDAACEAVDLALGVDGLSLRADELCVEMDMVAKYSFTARLDLAGLRSLCQS